ncbi:DNA-(apurinic or apyrimidinic site) lyase /endonuclease III [Bifidobacterium bohemicum]|uniref:Endonuclease III n=1 Tax=Bifidobacterium bohemicum DSM 22767 TaxID=1437606 RepID=A0A086ZHI2_9BIFI|nr:endonuclease III [Bifidobacterium bohemicum]KFI45982.1 endonuclease III [Bifidobacterium bohemicum DSM 22767]SCC03807.1 DNA-(apurinic or apyrimidinic site) lyase /endonuclease III [Bifidobacterium bohemicum]
MPEESKRKRLERMHAEYEVLRELIPSPQCALHFKTPFQLLVATVLSAQTTDVRVNGVTPALFARYGTPELLSRANPEQVEDIIHPVGFYHTKAAHIIELSSQISTDFNGEVPQSMEELTTLSGVGRKTANVVLGNAFGIPGFPVDTHVMRLTGRLRWRTDWRSTHPDPVKIEKEITACFAPEEWTNLSHRLILFGRSTCHARKPDCADCPLNDTCPSAGMWA